MSIGLPGVMYQSEKTRKEIRTSKKQSDAILRAT
jgi:hypothetical protein